MYVKHIIIVDLCSPYPSLVLKASGTSVALPFETHKYALICDSVVVLSRDFYVVGD